MKKQFFPILGIFISLMLSACNSHSDGTAEPNETESNAFVSTTAESPPAIVTSIDEDGNILIEGLGEDVEIVLGLDGEIRVVTRRENDNSGEGSIVTEVATLPTIDTPQQSVTTSPPSNETPGATTRPTTPPRATTPSQLIPNNDFQRGFHVDSFGTSNAESDTGYFYLVGRNGGLLYHAQRGSMNATPVCNRSGCRHDSKNCGAWLEATNIAWHDGKLYYSVTEITTEIPRHE
jgi:hypothetical protein